MLFGSEKNFCLAGIMDRACSEVSGAVPFKWNRLKLNSTLIYSLHARTDYKGSMNSFLTACSYDWQMSQHYKREYVLALDRFVPKH